MTKLSGNVVMLAYPSPTTDSPVRLTPLSILYPGVLWESQGKHVHYWDQRFDGLSQLDELIHESTDFAVSTFTGYQCSQAVALLRRAKALKPGITTHVGGKHAQILPGQVAGEPFVDRVWSGAVYGEHLFPYRPHTRHMFARGDFQYYTSRGCPFVCAFCALSSPWQPKPIDKLDRELKTIHGDIGFKTVSFSDPNIAFGAWHEDGKTVRVDRVQRIRDIGRTMRDIGATWDGNIRCPYLTPEMVEALAWSGCTSIEVGAESGDDYYLRRVIRKGHGVDAIKRAALNVRGSGISVMYSFLAYAPYETEEQRMRTFDLIDWIVETDPFARVSVYKFSPYPGSPMYEDAVTGRGCGYGCDRFTPPTTMDGWGSIRLMSGPLYWIVGLNFRQDNTSKNFPGEDYELIRPYVDLARSKWRARDLASFPCAEVEALVERQLAKAAA